MNVHIIARRRTHTAKSVHQRPVKEIKTLPLILYGMHTQQGAMIYSDVTNMERNRNSFTTEFFLDPMCLS